MTTAMILCAGLGTRLRPLTDELPKPLVWLGDRPLLAHIAALLAGGGVRRAVLNTHHLAHRFVARLLASLPLEATAVHEEKIAGTAGGIAGAASALGEGDVLVWNGDILTPLNAAALLETHEREAQAGAIATLVVTPRQGDEARPGQGTVGVDKSGAVVRLRGQVFGEEARGADFIGIYVVGAALRARLPREGCMVGDVYIPAMREGRRIATFETNGPFRDLGTIAEYLVENKRWLTNQGKRAWIGSDAVVDANVVVEDSIIGSGATVRGEGVLRGVVVWPGASVTAPLEDAVVLGDGRIARP